MLGLLVCLGASGLRAQTPLFQVAPRPTEVQTGATVGVGAVVTGSAAASYVWKKAGVVVGSGSAVAANDWKSVAAGASHTLALKNDGSLWGWGNNQNWQLALASVAAGNPRRSAPTRIGSAADWMGVFASGDRSCAIKKDGTAWYWGGTATSPEMKKVAGDQFWESAAFGGTGAMYLVSLGGVYAFQPYMESAPSLIGTVRDWASVSAWGEMVVALKRDGTLWGYNAMGAGMAQSSPEGGFYMVQSGRWKAACAGPGYAVALREDGTLWAWQRMGGGGGWGLFNNGWQTQYTPRRLGSRSDWKSLAADVLPLAVDGEGRVHQVAESWSWQVGEIPVACRSVVGRSVDSSKWNNEGLALGVDGTLWAWGGNDYGQLGDVQDTTSAAGMVRYDAVQVGVHQDWGLSSPVLGAPLGLVLPNFQTANLGVYELLVNNVAAGSVALAQWTSQPETRRFTAGGLLQLAAGGSLGAGTAPTYQWYRNGVALSGATSPSYSLANAQTSASGVYWLEMKRGGVAARSESASVVIEDSALAGVHTLLAAKSHAAASSALATMLQATPSHPAANVLKAFTDVYLLIQDSRTTLMLNQLGFTGSTDPFNFTLQHAGFPAGGALTSEARNWMKDILYPKLKEAEVRLGNVTSTGFIAALVASDFGSTSTETIPFDYGDVQVARAGLNLVMSLLKWVETQNTDVGLLALKDKRNTGGLSLESLLAMYPNLLNASATATEAQTEFVDRFGKAISYYLNFSAFANPAAGSTGARRLDAEQALFTLTTDDDREGERRLRLNCERLQASLAATSAGAGLQSFSLPTTGFEGTLAVQASPWVFFKHSPGWRNELPAFKANAYVPGTFRADTAIAFYPALKLEEIGRLEAELAAAEPGLTEWFKTGRETVPPNVQLLSLNSGSASVTLQNGASLATNGWLTVSGTVADVTGVGRVLVTRTSGVDVASAVARVVERAPATGAAARVYDWTAQLPAVVGAGTIAASAWDFSGNVTTTSAAVTLSAAAAAVLPVVPERAREIVAGGAGAMAVVVPTSGTLQFTWRRNGASLQAGTASAVDDWASVSIGGYHTAAIKQDGTLWTWGSNSDGQLGAGTARQFPQRVGNGSNWASVSCGRSYTVALTRSGSLWVSGRSPFGTFEQLTALTGLTATSQTWARVSASDNHALVLTRGGRLFVWSDGTGTPVDSGSDWAEMAAGLGRGARMNFAIKRDGTLWAWGDNANGHLGLGWGYYGTVSSPAQLGTDKDWLTVATCSSDTWSNVLSAAVKKDGTLWAWGFAPNFFPDLDWNSYGWGGQMTPRRVGPQDARWTAVAVAEYSVLGTRPDGTLFEIGDDWSSAKAVSPSIISTAAGGYSFGAVGADGVLWMWGWNNFGQIGNYTPRDLSNPWQDWRMTYAPEPVQAGVNADWGLPSPVSGIPVPLSFDPMPADGLGAYNLTVTRGASTATSVASFYSWSQSGQPSVVAVSGGSLRLQGGINAGGSTVSYQWYKNGVAVPGGTSPELAISAVPGNAGSYWVQAVSGKAAIRGRVTAAVVDSANVKEARKELNARNFSTASAQLNLALAANPVDGAALFLRSALDLYNLWSDPGVATNLAALGFTGSADPLNSTLRWSADGFPKGALSAPVRAWLVGTLYPKIAAAEANLAKVTDTGFLTSFGPYELGLQGEGAVVDYGDVQVLRAFLNVVLAAVKWLEAQNTDVDLAVLQLDGKNGRLSIESLLAKYPLLLTASTTGPAAQAEFVSRFKQALERYKVFSDFANPAGTPALGQRQDQSIGIARLETVENRDAEREFRNAVNKTLESINAADAVAGRRTLQTTDGFSLTASPHAFFQHAPGWRSDLPKFSRNLYQRNSINRALLQSMFPSLTLDDVAGLEEAMIVAEPKWTEALGTRADSTPPVLEMSPVTVLSSYDGWVSLDGTVQDAAGVRRVTVAVGPDGAKQVFESDLEELIPAADGTRRYKWRAAVPLSGMSGGSLAFSISAEDMFGGVLDSPLVKVLPVAPAPVVNSALAVSGTLGTAFRYQITATNSPTSFSASGLPAGLSVDTRGVISGTPTTAGQSTVTLGAVNTVGTGTASLFLTIAASTYGSDSFTSALSSTQWTAVQANHGTMTVAAANGHASFLVTGSSTAEQNAYLVWNGRPTANVDWSVEVRGRNAVPYSSGGGSSIQLVVADARAVSGAGAYNNFSVEFARTDSAPVNGRFQYGFSPGADPSEGQVVAKSSLVEFRLRVIYRAGAEKFESWYDDTGLGTNWKFLRSTPLSELILDSTTTREIAVGLLANTYYGPVSEGQLWVDDFRLVNTLLDVPVITTQPVGLTVGTGSVATFSVSATGTGLGYQWRKNGVNITGGTSAMYSIGSAQLSDAGTYSVVVGNASGGVTSGNAVLAVNNLPSRPVLTSATAASGTIGAAFSYQVTATNDPASFSASGLPAGLSVNASTGVISGTPTTAGQSTVTLGATNLAGTGSATLTLLVAQARPVITSGTLAGGVVGAAFSYQIAATNNPTSFTASGLPTGLSLYASTGLISGTPVAVGTSAITIGAANAGGVSTATVTLEIATGSPPVLRLQPLEVKVAEWAPAVFSVVATGGGTLRYQWRKNGVPIADATEATYRIEETQKTDEAVSGVGYDVVVTGDVGSVTSTRVGLTVVEGGVYVRENPVGSTVKLGAFYSLRVLVDDPDTTFQWRKNGVPISGGTGRTLILPSFRATDVGRYDVAIKDWDGKEVISAPAYVGTSPKVALNLQEITYQWEILAGGNGEGSSADGTGRAASFNRPSSIAMDGLGNLYVADTENHVIRRVTRSGVVSTVAGLAGAEGGFANGNALSTARFSYPTGVVVDKSGAVYIADQFNNTIRKLTNPGQPTAAVTTVAGVPGEPPDGNGPIRVEVDPNSAVYFMDQTSIRKVESAGKFTVVHGSLDYTEIGPTAMTLDRTGTLYAALSDGNIYSRNTNYGPYPSIRDLAFGAGNNLFAAMEEGVYLLGDLSQSFPPAGVPVSLNAYVYLDGDYSQFSPSGLTVDEDGSVYAVIDSLNAVVKGTPTGLPAFLLHPAGATGVHGVPLTLSAVAIGAGTVSYQWYRDGAAVPGATGASYTMAPGSARGGVYMVEASNAAGTVTSESATVVDTQLAILSEPLAASVVEGTPVALQVGWRGPSNTTFQWYRNSVAVAGGTSPSLNFSAVKSADQGDYRVALQAGTVSLTSATVRLTVNTPVSITSQPEKRDVVPFGKPFSLSVSATGTAPLTYRWFKNGVPLNGATASTYSVGAATDSDTGSYRVEVANVVGVISSETATVTVSTRGISVLKNPYPERPTSIIRGTAATLKLSVDANPPDALRTSYKLVRSSGAETGISGIVPASGQIEVPLRSLTAGGSYSVVLSREYVDGEVISGVTTSAFVVELRTLEEAAGTYELLLSDSNGAVGDNATYRGLLIATVSKTGAVSGRVLYNEAAPLEEATGTERAYVAVVRSFSSSFTPSAEDPAKLVCTPKLGVGTQANRQGLALELDFSAATFELSAVVRDRVSVPLDVDEEGCVSQGFGAVRGLTKLSVVPVESGTAGFGSLEGRYVIGSDFSPEDESGPGVSNNATLLAQVLKTGKVLWASRLSGSTGSGSATLSTTAADSAVAQIYQGRTSSTSKILSTTSLLGQLRFQVVSGGTAWSAGVLTANGDDKLERQSCYVSKSGGTPIFDDGFYLDNVETPAFRWSGVQVLDFQNGTSCRWPGTAANDLKAFFHLGSGEPPEGNRTFDLTAKDPVGEETYVWPVTLSPTGTVRVANNASSSPQPTLTFRFDKTRGEWTGSFVSPGTKLRCNLYGVVARPLDDSLRGAGWVETGALPSTRTGGWRLELLPPPQVP